MFFLCLVETIGIAIGSCIAVYSENAVKLRQYICPELNGGTLFKVFTNNFAVLGIFLAAAFLFGLSALGQPFGIALLTCIGAELGFSAAVMYSEKGISAYAAALVLYLPKTALVSAVALLAVRELLRCSTALLSGTASAGGHSDESPMLKLYCVKYIVLMAAAIIISVVYALMSCFFGNLIK